MRRGVGDAGRQILFQLLSCILVMLPTLSKSGSQLAIFSPASPPSSPTSLPTFLPSKTIIQVSAGSVASLQCHLGGLAPHHTVSWLRSHDVSVLTVGGLVFSSDPRITVVSHSRPVSTQGDWTLTIEDSQTQDTGSYRCQVNTEPSSSKTFTLEVVEKQREVEKDYDEEKAIVKVQNDQKTSDESDSSVQSLSIVSVRLGAGGREEDRFHFSKVELGEEEKAGELEEEDSDASSPPVAVSPVHTPSSPSLGPWGSSLGPPSLAAPVLSLLSLTLLVLGLGGLRGFYVRCQGGQATEQTRTAKPSRTRVSSMDSSRRSALRRQRRDDREEESLYEQCRLAQSRPLSPLIEVTEPTASLGHPSLFSLTTEQQIQETSLDSSDYSNTSEVTSRPLLLPTTRTPAITFTNQ